MKSNFALGTVQLGLDYGISNSEGKPSIKESFLILDEAYNNGIRVLDTAQAYGESEAVIGSYLKQSNNKFDVITKIPHSEKLLSADELFEVFKKSLNNMEVDSIYGVMFHSNDNFINNISNSLEFFRKIKSLSLVQKTGVSVYNSDQAEELLKYDEIDLIQAPMNIFDLELFTSGTLERLFNSNVEVYIRSVFLQGLFFLDESEIKKKLPEALEFIQMFNKFCKEKSLETVSVVISVINFILASKGKIVFGVEKPYQIKSNINLCKDIIDNDILNFFIDLSNKIPEKIKKPSEWSRK